MPRILVADDNTNIQKMVSLALQERGVEVTSVSNGEAAVRRVPDLNPDLILADIFMPVRNGYELCEWVKKDSKYSHIPVILLVGAFDPLDEKEARRVGADGVLKKPFIPPDPLIAMVTSTLEKIPKASEEPAPAKPAPPPAPPVVAPAANAPAKVTTAPAAPAFVIPAPETSEETAPDFGFGAGRTTLEDEPEDSVTAPRADFGQQAEDEFEEPEPQSQWRPSTIAFEAPQEEPRPLESALDDAAPATHAGPLHSEGHARELSGTLGGEESERFFDEPAAPEGSAESLDSHLKPAAPHVPEPEPSFSTKSSHWMDLMSSNAAGQPQRDWLSSLAASQPAERPGPLETARETENMEVAPASVERSAAEAHVLESAAVLSHTLQENTESAPATEDDSFFADEAPPSAAASEATDELHAPEQGSLTADESEPVHIEWPEDQQSEPLSAAEPWQGSAEPVDEQHGDASVFKVHEDASDRSKAASEPELVAPSPVRPAPEPLLVDESEKKSSDYDAREEEIPPVFSFLPEVEKQAAVHSASVLPEADALAADAPEFSHEDDAFRPSAESQADASLSEPPASHAEDVSAPFDEEPAAFLEASPSTASHEIPPAGSLSRENVSAIPFLNPPAGFDQDKDGSSMHEPASDDGVAVEEVVERVLSKIEPQLRDLLSQNLKPLIESLVQNELQKKER